jgi:hypothetical protein
MIAPLHIPDSGWVEGERRRDRALSRVQTHHAPLIWRAQLDLLVAMRGRPDRTGTGDDITPPGYEHIGSAGWIGAAVRQLAVRGLIVFVEWVRSTRASRHGNQIRRWRLADEASESASYARVVAQIGHHRGHSQDRGKGPRNDLRMDTRRKTSQAPQEKDHHGIRGGHRRGEGAGRQIQRRPQAQAQVAWRECTKRGPNGA